MAWGDDDEVVSTPIPPAAKSWGDSDEVVTTAAPTQSITSNVTQTKESVPPKLKSSIFSDVAKSGATGLVEGLGNLLGFPVDAVSAIDKGTMWAVTKAAEKAGMISAETGARIRDNPHSLANIAPSYLGAKGINSALSAAGDAIGLPEHKPETVAGDYARTIGSFLPGATALSAPRAILGNAIKYGALPGAVSEAAGQATKDTGMEPWARAAGAAVGMAPGIAKDVIQSPARQLRDALKGMSDPQQQVAQRLLDESRAAQAPLTVPEAAQYTTNGATRLGQLQRAVEQSPEGGDIMRQFYAVRPEQTKTYARDTIDQISPLSMTGMAPTEVAPRVQAAAESEMVAANTARTNAVDKLYAAAAGDRVPLPDMEAYLSKLDTMIAADKTGLISPTLSRLRDSLTETPAVAATATTPAVARVPITDIENLDRARKYWRDLTKEPQWQIENALPKEEAGKIGNLLGELRQSMVDNSKNFEAAKLKYADISENVVNPLKRSPTGELATADTFDAQANILFGNHPLPVNQRQIGQAVTDVVKKDPDAAKQLVRMYLDRELNTAITRQHGMDPQSGGWKFTKLIQGDPQQRKNLEAAIRALPGGDLRWSAMDKAIRILEAQGARESIGSSTFSNLEMGKALSQDSKLIEAAVRSPSILSFGNMLARWRKEFLYGRNTQQFAKLFTEGSLEDLRKIASAPVGGVRGAAALANTLLPRDGYAKGGAVSADLLPHFESASQETGVPLPLLLAVSRQESNFNPDAKGTSGERGLMQIMPSTAAKPGYGVAAVNPDELFDPATNVRFGARYLSALGKAAGVKDWNDPAQSALALRRYNGGGDPNYVYNVMQHSPFYSGLMSTAPTIESPIRIEEPDYPGSALIHQEEEKQDTEEPTVLGIPESIWNVLDKNYKERLIQAAVQNGTLNETQAKQLMSKSQSFAEGGFVEAQIPSTPEPQADIAAQTDSMMNPESEKNAVFIASGSPYPPDIPVGTIIVRRPEGDLMTTDINKAAEFLHAQDLTDKNMADILGYAEPKSEVQSPEMVMQGVEPTGAVSSEMLSSPNKTDDAVKAILAQSPTAAIRAITPDQAQQRRQRLGAFVGSM